MPLDPVSSGDPHVPAHNAERTAINDLEVAVGDRIPFPPGAATGDLLRWDGTAWVTTETRFFEGEGRPDGVFAAPVGSRYIDKTAEQGAVEWVKRSGGDSNVGWLVLAGDTGWRNIASLATVPGGATVHSARVRRLGHVVDMFFDLTMPTANGTWTLFNAMTGFGPGYSLYAGLHDNNELASTGGTLVDSDGGVFIYKTLAGKRDRFHGTWLTSDPWPTVLPGAAI